MRSSRFDPRAAQTGAGKRFKCQHHPALPFAPKVHCVVDSVDCYPVEIGCAHHPNRDPGSTYGLGTITNSDITVGLAPPEKGVRIGAQNGAHNYHALWTLRNSSIAAIAFA